jgi:hypothetical protein
MMLTIFRGALFVVSVFNFISTEILGASNYESHLGFPVDDLRNVHYGPIEQTTMTPGWGRSIIVQIDVDHNNSVGVLLKRRFRFRVWGAPQDPMVAISYGVAMCAFGKPA